LVLARGWHDLGDELVVRPCGFLNNPAAQHAATDAFLTGYHWAMTAGGLALAAAGITAFVGLRAPVRRAPAARR
jgi:hypothetical protein